MTASKLVPDDAWDTHIHVLDPGAYPFVPTRSYTPAPALFKDYPRDNTGCKNIVVVQATVQGTSKEPLTAALTDGQGFHGHGLRGLAVLDLDKVSDSEIEDLHHLGVRGVRMHEVSWGYGQKNSDEIVAEKIKNAVQRLSGRGWILDLYLHPKSWAAIAPTIKALPPAAKVIADHWAGFKPGEEATVEFNEFLKLLREKRVYVKLSASERQYDGHEAGMAALEPLAKAIIEAGPDRIMYASDWPNTALASSREGKTKAQRLSEVEEYRKVDQEAHIQYLREWIKDDSTWRSFWVDTPNSLFN